MKVLVLGGTAEARQLVEALGDVATLSLAGVTRKPLSGPHRVGGFGGAEGLAAFLRREGFDGIIDATHPFAAQMSRNAFDAATALGVPLLRLERPAWLKAPAWREVEDLAAAAKALPAGARVFLTVGSLSLDTFAARGGIWCLTRSIEPPTQPPPHGEVVLQRPPFSVQNELELMVRHKITHLVSKNAGGEATRAKLEAAAQSGVQVIMVKRPRLPEVLTVETVVEAVKWVENLGE